MLSFKRLIAAGLQVNSIVGVGRFFYSDAILPYFTVITGSLNEIPGKKQYQPSYLAWNTMEGLQNILPSTPPQLTCLVVNTKLVL